MTNACRVAGRRSAELPGRPLVTFTVFHCCRTGWLRTWVSLRGRSGGAGPLVGPAVGNPIPPLPPRWCPPRDSSRRGQQAAGWHACHGQPPAQRRHPESTTRWAGAAPAVGPDGASMLAASPGLWAGLSWGAAHRPRGDRAPGRQPGRALGGGAVAGGDRRTGRQSPHQSLHSGPRVLVGPQASEDGLLLLRGVSRS